MKRANSMEIEDINSNENNGVSINKIQMSLGK